MATALVSYTLVITTLFAGAISIPYYGRPFERGEKETLVGLRLRGVMNHLNVRDIALGDVVRERAEEKGYGPEIDEQMEKLMVELYLEKRKREAQEEAASGIAPSNSRQLYNTYTGDTQNSQPSQV